VRGGSRGEEENGRRGEEGGRRHTLVLGLLFHEGLPPHFQASSVLLDFLF
jgi:hypothetical protein